MERRRVCVRGDCMAVKRIPLEEIVHVKAETVGVYSYADLFTRKPLFLSLQNRRISVRAVEKLVKKYSKLVNPLKKITPHKLRSTFGTNLYRETNDIYVVADVLGHKDVNTTKKHYAALEDERRRKAASAVKLRKE